MKLTTQLTLRDVQSLRRKGYGTNGKIYMLLSKK